MRIVFSGLVVALGILGVTACTPADRPPTATRSSSGTATASSSSSPVTTSKLPQETFVMPNLLGKFWTDSEPLMRAMGWEGAVVKLPNARDTGYPPSAIVKQDPPAGQRVPKDIAIQLQFAAD